MRSIGAAPAVMWRSDARRSMTSSRTSAKSRFIRGPYRQVGPFPLRPPGGLDQRSAGAGDPRYLGHRREAALDLLEPILAQAPHALTHGHGGDLFSRGTLQGERADFIRHRHDLVETYASPVAHSAAAHAPDRLVGLDVVVR